jgi:hypothetical protein
MSTNHVNYTFLLRFSSLPPLKSESSSLTSQSQPAMLAAIFFVLYYRESQVTILSSATEKENKLGLLESATKCNDLMQT